jgi:hypothetical protein
MTPGGDAVGLNVLLIGIGFYDYERAIADEMRRQGARVFQFDETPRVLRLGPVASLLQRSPEAVKRLVQAHQSRMCAELASTRIDKVVVIKGEHVSSDLLDTLRRQHPGVELVAYHWDSMARYPRLLEQQRHYDHVFTFDHADATRFPAFHLRPLFYRSEVAERPAQVDASYDLSFIGWMHHARHKQVLAIDAWAQRQQLETFLYLYTGKLSWARLAARGQHRFVYTKTLDYSSYLSVLHSSRVVVDLPHPNQTGMTMRAIEAIGAGKKLITTARDITKYSFYRAHNILVVDPETLEIDPEFLRGPPQELRSEEREPYALRSWVREVLRVGQPQHGPTFLP